MDKKQLKLLENYLWELTRQIGYTPGLPVNWQVDRVKELADIFRPTNSNQSKKH